MGEDLNAAQKNVVGHTDGPLLVVAGAGTGKTRVIVERIARLVDTGVPKQQILALTFTEKAAQEMLDRVGELLKSSYGVEMNIFTFNGFGQELLREFAVEIGLSPNMQLIGDSGKVVLLREHLDELGLDYFSPISSPDSQLATIAEYFSKLKQQLVKPDAYKNYATKLPHADEDQKLEKQRHSELANAFAKYLEITRTKNIIDYDDQIYLLVELLQSRPNVLRKLQERYKYILVDEFQDTNPMQSQLLDLLAEKHKNLMAVGDDDQSIYGWRGATLSNILEFQKRYPKATEITLIDNYRSTQETLDHAYRMIQHNNPDRLEVMRHLDKRLQADRGKGTTPQQKLFSRLDAELAWVAEDIARRIKSGADPGSIAVLTRRNDSVRRMHQTLEAADVEHTVAGIVTDLYVQPIVSSMIEALKAIADIHDNQALYHTLTGPLFKLDPKTIGESAAKVRRTHDSLHNELQNSNSNSTDNVLQLIDSWRDIAHESSVCTLAYRILDDSGLKAELYAHAQHDEQSARSVQMLGQWFNSLRDFAAVADVGSAHNYLESLPALKAEGETIADDSGEIVNTLPVVMSVHKAKGLEWDTVYIIDCTENSFPLRRYGSSLVTPDTLSQVSSADDHYSEERRLMYVASTRARDELIITHSQTHNGRTQRKPSRFISEMFGDASADIVDADSQQTTLDLFAAPSTESTVSLPSSMISGKNIVLTASQASDYLRCPLDFKYRYVLQVPQPPDPSRAVGTLLHEIIQQVNEARFKSEKPPTEATLLKLVDDQWPQEGYLSAQQRTRALSGAKNSLKKLLKRLQSDPIPISIEEQFKVHVPDSRLLLKGRIDVVLPSVTYVEIRDYKTSTSATTPQKAKRSAQASTQLEIYALAWQLKHGELPGVVSLDFVQTGQIGSVKKQPKTIENLQKKLADAAENILNGQFPPGQNHLYCQHPIEA